MRVNRREFFRSAAILGVSHPVLQAFTSKQNPFLHGIASGDPLSDSVILWTRISPLLPGQHAHQKPDNRIHYRWLISRSSNLLDPVATGYGSTDSRCDYTVKVDVKNLQPDTTYYYRFSSMGFESPVGRTKTLPTGQVENIRFAVCSCANYASGFFNAYADIAKRAELDAVLHLGDYLYEYGVDEYDQSSGLGRTPIPSHEIISLSDYRIRHSQYKTDADLQEVHRQHPFICIWDDHEFANDAWLGGADNHSADEGDWQQRKSAAMQAYFEWMPIRENPEDPHRIYRQFKFGDLLDLYMLDTRMAGREQPTRELERYAQTHGLLGQAQEDWLYPALSQSQKETTWRLIGQQVMMAQLGSDLIPLNFDQWDGYPACRQRFLQHLHQQQIDNVVVLTGDIHSSWANELCRNPYADDDTARPLAVEFITPGITSPGISDPSYADNLSATVKHLMPHIKFQDFFHRGYMLVDINRERVQTDWYHLADISNPKLKPLYAGSMYCRNGQAQLQATNTPIMSPIAQAPALAPRSRFGQRLTQVA